MKKFFEEAELEIVKFDVEDVITSSVEDPEIPDFGDGEDDF